MGTTFIRVRVKPNSRRSVLVAEPDGDFTAEVKAPATEGRANAELITLVAEHFHCPKVAVSIKSGRSGRRKLIRIARR